MEMAKAFRYNKHSPGKTVNSGPINTYTGDNDLP
jgi:hypothetical protein